MSKNNEAQPREPWFAVNLSMFFVGIGQIYSRRVLRGCVLILSEITLIFLGEWLVFSSTGNTIVGSVFLITAGAVYIWSLFDAHRCARKANTEDFESLRKGNKDPWLAVFLSRLFPGLGHMYVRKWGWGIIFVILLITLSTIGNIHSLFSTYLSILLAFICFHAYISAPVRRERSKKLITVLAFIILIAGLRSNYFPLGYGFKWEKGIGSHFLTRGDIVKAFNIPASSMHPTLRRGDKILARKSANYVPERGDIIIFKFQEDHSRSFMKRIVALGGESVEIKDGSIYINGDKLEGAPFWGFHYESLGEFGVEGKAFLVPNHSLFVLGDNSKNSKDSRYFGSVPKVDVIGKAYKIYWPLSRMGSIE